MDSKEKERSRDADRAQNITNNNSILAHDDEAEIKEREAQSVKGMLNMGVNKGFTWLCAGMALLRNKFNRI